MRLPPKLFLGVGSVLAIFGFSAYMFLGESTQNFVQGKADNEPIAVTESVAVPVSVPAAAPTQQLSELQAVEHINYMPTKPIFEQVATVVSSNNLCIAKDASGRTLAISSEECMLFAANPYSASYIPMAALEKVYVEKESPSAEQPNNNPSNL